MPETLDPKVLQQSIQEFEPKDSFGGQGADSFYGFYWPDDILPGWGNRQRDRVLRRYAYATHNTLVQGTIAGFVKKICSTPWEISNGGKIVTKKWQHIFQSAQFGQGWTDFVARFVWDYLTQDFGAVGEIIGYGDPDKPLPASRPVLGVAALDSLRCIATGNPEYPLIYYSRRSGKMHRLHYTRCFRFVDMPAPDEWQFGNGFCSLSRAISLSNMQILMGKYGNEKLNDLPPAGLLKTSNAKNGAWLDMLKQYEADRAASGASVYRNFMQVDALDPSRPLEIEFIPFAQVPDGYNYREYMDIHVSLLANAFGLDRQDIWELSGGGIGTGSQSDMLNSKSRGKGYGYVISGLERLINKHILPEELEFKFKFQDDERDEIEARNANLWADAVSKLSGILPEETRLLLLANRVPAFADVLIDAQGNVRLPDDDPKADGQETTADDVATLVGEADQEAQPVTATDTSPTAQEAPTAPPVPPAPEDDEETTQQKAIQATRVDFEDDFADAVAGAQNDTTNRKWFGITLRQLVSDYGLKAYIDGLKAGGVDTETLDGDDVDTYAQLVAGQAGYIRNFADAIFDGVGYTPEIRAEMWYTKSISPFYYAGLASADRNGMYEFVGDDGDESCPDCTRLKYQVHRMKDWKRKRLRPGVDTDNFKCKGYHCNHKLQKKLKARSRGKF